MKRFTRIVHNGRLTKIGIALSVLGGAAISYLALEYLPYLWLKIIGLLFGLTLMGIGGYSGRAIALDLPPPFSSDPNGWRAAEKSYTREDREGSERR